MKKRIKKMLSAVLIAGLIAPSFPADLVGMAMNRVSAAEETQAASPMETVYLNHFTDVERSIDFNSDWKFYLGEATGAEQKAYNDANWTTLNLPHDYSIDQEYSSLGEGESGFRLGGIGWYRKAFTVDSNLRDKRITIDFDGVYMDSTVYLNGTKLGGHPYGYTPFSFELPSDILDYEGENVLVVKVNHQTPSSRWYSGSGIYRDVKLSITDKVHIDRYGVLVTTSGWQEGNKNPTSAMVNIDTTIVNDSAVAASGVKIKYTITKKGEEATVATTEVPLADSITAGNKKQQATNIEVQNPALWSSWDTGTPNLYVLKTQVFDGSNNLLDEYDTTFGFRTFKFERDKGFSINGTYIKLKGVCMHHDQGALGSEAWEDAILRQVRLLKEMGCNSIRVTHNPAAEILIDICNREGILVIDEAFDGWNARKNGNTMDYARFFDQNIEADNQILGGNENMWWAEYDIKTMVQRAHNAPSVIMWSLGNEIVEGANESVAQYPEIADNLIRWVDEVDKDSYRKITFGDNKLKGNSSAETRQVAQKIHAAGGIIGFNYATWNGQMVPQTNSVGSGQWIVYGSETSSPHNSRGVYEVLGNGASGSDSQDSPIKDHALTSYDNQRASWGATASNAWWETIRFDGNLGEYPWTGFDYLGEPTPWNPTSATPNQPVEGQPKSSFFGIIDTAGIPKDTFYLYRSLWYDKEDDYTVHVLPTWDREDLPNNGAGSIKVDVYSDAPKVELRLITKTGEEKVVGQAKTMTTRKSTVGWNNNEGIHTYRTVDGAADDHTSLYYTWNINYEEGTLKAVAYDSKESTTPIEASKITGRTEVSTTKGEHQLSLNVDKYTLEEGSTPTITADGKSLAYVVMEVQDEDGKFVNGAEPEITVTVDGPGVLLGMDNGFQADLTSYQSNKWQAHRGKAVAIIQSTKEAGEITVKAISQGLVSDSVTITTIEEEVESDSSRAVSVEMSKIYYLKKGSTPVFPETIKVNYADGTYSNKKVIWDTNGLSTSEEGVFSVGGTTEDGWKVAVNIYVIGEVAALENYSTYIRVGENPSLPAGLPAITAEGEILNTVFDVKWDYSTLNKNVPGIYTVQGSASVFGAEFLPTATVRVTDGELQQGDNAVISKTKIEENLTSDTNKDKVYDGSTDGSYWQGVGSYKFGWDTAVNVNQLVLYMEDTAPISESIELSWSGVYEAPTYTTIDDIEVKNERVNGIVKRTFTFPTVPALGFKVNFEDEVKLYEAQLYTSVTSFDVGSNAELDSLVIDGRLMESDIVESGNINIFEESLDVSKIAAVGKDNAAVTILPAYEDRILILTKSEDGTIRGSYTISLNIDMEELRTADYDGFDYDYTATTVTPCNQQNDTNNAANNAIDNVPSTIWHSVWGGTPQDQLYIDINLKEKNAQNELVNLTEPIKVNALRYLPRTDGSQNGRVVEYKIAYSLKGDGTDWKDIPGATGTWNGDTSWKIATFDEVQARAIRLYGVRTQSDSANSFMSAAEIRVCTNTIDIYSVLEASLDETVYEYTGSGITPSVNIQSKDADKTLMEGRDYEVSYVDNINPGKGMVLIKGKGIYYRTISLPFTINEKQITFEGYEDITITTNAGQKPVLPGIVTVNYSYGEKRELEVEWPDIAPSYYEQEGVFHIYGVVKGLFEKVRAEVIVLSSEPYQAIVPVSLLAVSGSDLTLPEQVKAIKADGTSVFVTPQWQMEDIDLDQPAGTVITVTGTVEGSALTAVAKVRLVQQLKVNLALNSEKAEYPKPYVKYSSNDDQTFKKKWAPVDGVKNFALADGHRWDNWERNVKDTETWFGVEFDKDYIINQVNVYFATEVASDGTDSKVRLAKDYDIQYYTGEEFDVTGNEHQVKTVTDSPLNNNDNWTTVSYNGIKPPVPSYENFSTQETQAFFEPVTTDFVRVLLKPYENQWTGLVEVEVWGYEALEDYEVEELHRDFEVTNIFVGEEDIFDRISENEIYEYPLEQDIYSIDEISIDVKVTNNAIVTIAKESTGENAGLVTITVMAEDGNEAGKKTYRIKFPLKERPHIPTIEHESIVSWLEMSTWNEDNVEIPLGGALDINVTVYGHGVYDRSVTWILEPYPLEDGVILKEGTKIIVSKENSNYALLKIDQEEEADQLKITVVSNADNRKKDFAIVSIDKPEEPGGEEPGGNESGGNEPGGNEPGSGSDNDGPGKLPENLGDVDPDHVPSNGIIPEGLWIGGIEDLEYTGSNVTHQYAVYDGTKKLVEKRDYTVKYKNNKNAYEAAIDGVNPKKQPTITVTGKGNYKDKVEVTFDILKVDFSVSDNGLVFADSGATVKNGKVKVSPYISYFGKKLSAKEFEIKGSVPTTEGTHTITLAGKGNFKGERDITLTISASAVPMDKVAAAVDKQFKKAAYTGNAVEPTFSKVQYKKDKLVAGTHYTVRHENNVAAGTASVILTAIPDSGYIGEKVVTFAITPKNNIAKIKVENLPKTGYDYTGSEIKPLDAEMMEAGLSTAVVKSNGASLVNGEDYTVSYTNNINKGTATMVITGIAENGSMGTKKVTFKIAADAIVKAENDFTITLVEKVYGAGASASDNGVSGNTTASGNSQPGANQTELPKDASGKYQAAFEQGGARPVVVVEDVNGKLLVEGVDYTVSYKDNAKLTTGKLAKAVVKGKGNYAGTAEEEFAVVVKEVQEIDGRTDVTVVAKDKVTNNKGAWKQNIKVVDVNGKAIPKKYADTKAAKYYLEAVWENGIRVEKGEEITSKTKDAMPVGAVIRVEVPLKECYSGTAIGTYMVIEKGKDISKMKIKIQDQGYIGEEILLDKEDLGNVTLNNVSLTLGKDFEIVEGSYVKNVNKGTAKVTFKAVEGSGYGGTKTVSFKITPMSVKNEWKGILSTTLSYSK